MIVILMVFSDIVSDSYEGGIISGWVSDHA